MTRILKWIFLAPLLILAVVAVVYVGSCAYSNFVQKPMGTIDYPDISEARYRVTIVNTGNTLFTSDYEENGSAILVRGYWELVGTKYHYRNNEVVLDKRIFGEIKITRR